MTKKINRFDEQLVRELPFYIYVHCTIIECLLASSRKVVCVCVCVCVCVSYCVFKFRNRSAVGRTARAMTQQFAKLCYLTGRREDERKK